MLEGKDVVASVGSQLAVRVKVALFLEEVDGCMGWMVEPFELQQAQLFWQQRRSLSRAAHRRRKGLVCVSCVGRRKRRGVTDLRYSVLCSLL